MSFQLRNVFGKLPKPLVRIRLEKVVSSKQFIPSMTGPLGLVELVREEPGNVVPVNIEPIRQKRRSM